MSQEYQIGNYQSTYNNFQLAVPERFNWAYEVFDLWAQNKSKIALKWVGPTGKSRDVTFDELRIRSSKVANLLSGIGASPGDNIFIMLPHLVEWWEIVLGCIRGRFVSVPGPTLLTPNDIEYRINSARIKIAIIDHENAEKLLSVKHKCPELEQVVVVGGNISGTTNYEDLIQLASSSLKNPHNLSTEPLMGYFTSGTTGYPKMVINTHSSYPIGHIITGKFWLDNRPSDLHYTIADTGWAQAAWTLFFAPWNMGAAIMAWDQRGAFDPESTMKLLEDYPISTFFAPPTAYRMLTQLNLSNYQLKTLRHCVGAGEAVNPDLIEIWKQGTGHHIWEGYGLTETVLCAATFPGMNSKPGSMGVAAPGYTLGIVDDDGNELPRGEEGEVAILTNPDRPVGLFSGYWENPEANAKSFRGNWYFTGDRASMDDDGYLWFVGRGDDVIISASYRIGPFEVESAVAEHPSVAETAVIGAPHPVRGNIVKAYVVLAEGYKPSDSLTTDIQNHVKKVTAPYKYPRVIEYIAELPKTISGKIRRNELRDRETKKTN